MSVVFHLNNKEAKCELKVNYNNETLPFCSEPKHLGVTLTRQSSYPRGHPTCWASSQMSHTVTPEHLLYSVLTCPPGGNAWHLKSRHSFVPVAQQLFSSSDDDNRSATFWSEHWWNAEWLENTTTSHCIFIPDVGNHLPGMAPPRKVRIQLKRTSVVRFRPCLHIWGMAPSAACECDVEEKTVGHVVLHCSIRRPWPDSSG